MSTENINEYSKEGRLVSTTSFNKDGTKEYTQYYDGNNEVISMYTFHANRSVKEYIHIYHTGKTVTFYDDTGIKNSYTHYNKDDVKTVEYTYRLDGTRKEKREYNLDGSFKSGYDFINNKELSNEY